MDDNAFRVRQYLLATVPQWNLDAQAGRKRRVSVGLEGSFPGQHHRLHVLWLREWDSYVHGERAGRRTIRGALRHLRHSHFAGWVYGTSNSGSHIDLSG